MKIRDCEHPDDLLYDPEHGLWARREGASFRVGLAPSLVWISGGFDRVGFVKVGSRVASGSLLGTVEGTKHFDVVRAPFACGLGQVNEGLLRDPRLLNRDPYGSGWFAVIEPVGAPSGLLSLGEARSALEERLERLSVHCFAEFPDEEMVEIGVECSAVLALLDERLSASKPGTVIHLVTDDPTARIEMERWSAESGNPLVDFRKEGSLQHFLVKKPLTSR